MIRRPQNKQGHKGTSTLCLWTWNFQAGKVLPAVSIEPVLKAGSVLITIVFWCLEKRGGGVTTVTYLFVWSLFSPLRYLLGHFGNMRSSPESRPLCTINSNTETLNPSRHGSMLRSRSRPPVLDALKHSTPSLRVCLSYCDF